MSQAVHHGEFHKPNNSYRNKIPTNNPMDAHLFRSTRGQFIHGLKNRRAALRTSMNGHAKQKKLPAQSSTNTSAPRKCTQLNTVARFLGASVGPSNPCKIMIMLMSSSGICSTVRECRHFKKRPTPGICNKSNSDVRERSAGAWVGGIANVLLRRYNFRLICPKRLAAEPSLNGSRVGETVLMQRAVARRLLLTYRRKHVVVHADHHRHKHDGIIEKVEFNARNYQLQNAHRNGLAPKIVMHGRLRDEQQVFKVMPELNNQRSGPPLARSSRKPFTQNPNANKHHQRITVMQSFRLDQPRIPQT